MVIGQLLYRGTGDLVPVAASFSLEVRLGGVVSAVGELGGRLQLRFEPEGQTSMTKAATSRPVPRMTRRVVSASPSRAEVKTVLR